MKCIIVEDEQHAAQHLEFLLKQCKPDIEVMAKIDSVTNAVQWLKHNTTDLIFLDVQLGDGISFSIFDNVEISTPVIFTTSFDQFAIKAFEVNSLAYLLKPVDLNELKAALKKYDLLYANTEMSYESLSRYSSAYQKRFLVELTNSIKSIAADEIAYFVVQNRHVFIVLNSGEQYLFDTTLDALEKRLDPELFFRINRQFIMNIKAIHKMQNETRGRVRIESIPPFKEEMIVSIDRAQEFRNWLNK